MLSLVIPTYNERENIEVLNKLTYEVLRETGLSFEVIIVDDDSPDGTWKVAHAMVGTYQGLRVIRRVHERGLAHWRPLGCCPGRSPRFGTLCPATSHFAG